jgi:hypothetical protein
VLRKTPAQFYGRKVLYGLLGLILPALMTGFFALHRASPMPFVVPVAATVILSGVLFMMPSRDISADAKKARSNFARALSGLHRAVRPGTQQRRRCVRRPGQRRRGGRLVGVPPDRAGTGPVPLQRSTPVGLPQGPLRRPRPARAGRRRRHHAPGQRRVLGGLPAAARPQRLARSCPAQSSELAQAGVVEERMYLPASLLGVVFLALLMAPPLLRLFGAS